MVSSASITPSTSFMSCFLLFMILFLNGSAVSAQLSGSSFYLSTCPKVYSIVEDTVNSAVKNESRMGASLLRLFFHDCFVNGCDASILLDDTENFTGEKTAFPNDNSIRGFEVIDAIKSKVEAACKGIVSCADILALAARDAVVMLGGSGWQVQLGRRDSTTANYTGANTDLPSPSFNLTDLIAVFQNKGFTAKEMVVLSGAHTIGQARCVTFRDRIYNDIGDINSTFASSLKSSCPSSGGDNNLSPLDTTTSNKFDNAYFKNLQLHEGLLHSDQQLFSGGSADSDVASYASNSHLFQVDIGKAMVKMGSLSPITGSNGQIRANCRIVAV